MYRRQAENIERRTGRDDGRMGHEPDRGLNDLFTELSGEISRLVSLEIRLFKMEMSSKVGQAGKAIGYFVGAGLIAYAAFFFLSLAIVMGLANWLPNWAAALVVALAWGGIGFWLVQEGKRLLSATELAPKRTLETLQEITHDDGQHARAA